MYGLHESLCDNAEETFIKIGYSDTELNFNYPSGTLKSLLGNREMSDGELCEALDAFFAKNATFSGSSWHKRRAGVMITLHQSSVKAIYERFDKDGFLSELYRAVSAHGASENSVREVFSKHRPTAVAEKSRDPDFDLLVSFEDGSDPYRYLFKFEHGHCDFHRLLPDDFEEIYRE